MNDKTPEPLSTSRRRARQLRIIGVVVLLLGLGGAGVVYWTRPPDLSDDPSMLGYNRAETRQMGMLFGKSGEVLEGWVNDLKQTGTQVVLIAITAVLVAVLCFYFARLWDNDGESG